MRCDAMDILTNWAIVSVSKGTPLCEVSAACNVHLVYRVSEYDSLQFQEWLIWYSLLSEFRSYENTPLNDMNTVILMP
jgi:hypothetical protein